ncbi:1-acyl-sn-glycerol-3-phosphate acyltransferase [bacterium]|nr:1-acyl-sn-glycerol-3-phosphate acyltransferase [bacterium]
MPGWWGKFLYWCFWSMLWPLAKLFFWLKAEGIRNVPRRGGALIASNHLSHLDPPLLGLACPRMVVHMAKKELFARPLLQWYLKAIGTIIVHRGRGRQAIVDALDYVERGACVVIFPEGTRSISRRLSKGHSGALVIAIGTGCPIVPCAITGTEQAWPKGSKRIRIAPIKVRFGEAYTIKYDGDRQDIPRDVLERECFRLMERIEALLPEHLRPHREDKLAWYGELAAP